MLMSGVVCYVPSLLTISLRSRTKNGISYFIILKHALRVTIAPSGQITAVYFETDGEIVRSVKLWDGILGCGG